MRDDELERVGARVVRLSLDDALDALSRGNGPAERTREANSATLEDFADDNPAAFTVIENFVGADDPLGGVVQLMQATQPGTWDDTGGQQVPFVRAYERHAMNRRGRNPNFDLQRHIITGESGPFNGQDIANELDDASINYDDPSEFGGQANTFEGDPDATRNADNLAESVGLASAARFGTPVDMEMANDTNVGGLRTDATVYDTGIGPDATYGERGLTIWRRDNGQ